MYYCPITTTTWSMAIAGQSKGYSWWIASPKNKWESKIGRLSIRQWTWVNEDRINLRNIIGRWSAIGGLEFVSESSRLRQWLIREEEQVKEEKGRLKLFIIWDSEIWIDMSDLRLILSRSRSNTLTKKRVKRIEAYDLWFRHILRGANVNPLFRLTT